MNTTHHTPNIWDTGNDDLERLALEECIKRQRVDHDVSVLVIADGNVELCGKFAHLGAQVVCAGPSEKQQQIQGRILAAGLKDDVRFKPVAFPELPDVADCEPYDIIYVRQGLCHLPYAEARKVIHALSRKLRIGGKLFVAILGLHSELAEGYDGTEQIVNERFAELDSTMIQRYGIAGEVCLYTERNLFMLLMEAGVSVLRTFTTTYGNVRGVAVRV